MEIPDSQRDHFDALLEEIIDQLPDDLRELLEEVPVVVEDYPSRQVISELRLRRGQYLCGLHSGVPLTERSVQHSGVLPNVVTIYRAGVMQAATDRHGRLSDKSLREQIRITLLHEMGHYFGLDEDDLRELGYH